MILNNSQSSSSSTTTTPFPPVLLFLAGILLGSHSTGWQLVRQYGETFLITSYLCCILGFAVVQLLVSSAENTKTTSVGSNSSSKSTTAAVSKAPVTTGSTSTETATATTSEKAAPAPNEAATPSTRNLTGSYKLLENNNFENFLAVQGVPWALRRAANAARPTHKITQESHQITIQIMGLIESSTTYPISGILTDDDNEENLHWVESVVRGRVFRDAVLLIPSGVLVRKQAVEEGYRVTVERSLSEDGQEITMTSTAYFPNEPQKENVVCLQKFQRVE